MEMNPGTLRKWAEQWWCPPSDGGERLNAAADAWEAQNKANEIDNGRLAQERDDAVMAHHLAEKRLEAAEAWIRRLTTDDALAGEET